MVTSARDRGSRSGSRPVSRASSASTTSAARLPDLDPRSRAEVTKSLRRVVDKLLHAPTVRVKELASAPGGDTYAAALRELFDLDPKTADAVARADVVAGETLGGEGT